MEGADCGILLIQNARWTFPKNTKTFFNKRLFKERVRFVLLNKTTNLFQAWERRGVPLFKILHLLCVQIKVLSFARRLTRERELKPTPFLVFSKIGFFKIVFFQFSKNLFLVVRIFGGYSLAIPLTASTSPDRTH